MKSGKAFLVMLLAIALLSAAAPPDARAIFSFQAYIPDSIVSLSSGYAIVVDKQAQKLYVFRKNSSIEKVLEIPCSTGKKPGAKQEAGDARTPNGIFFIYRFYDNTELTSTYGPMAFHLDFPNILDRRSGRNGTNIWIHGTNKPLQPFQSNGCVALRNKDIEQLAGYVFLNKTPVIIEESINWVPQDKKVPDRDELERIVAVWDKAVNEGDARALESLYMSDSREKAEYKPLLQKSPHLRSLVHHMLAAPRDISILKQNNSAVVLFDKITSVKSDTSFQGTYVKLFLEKKDNHWFIVEDVSPSGPQLLAARSSKTVPKESREAAPVQQPAQQRTAGPPQQPAQAKQPNAVPEAPGQQKSAVKQAQASNDQETVGRLVEKWAESWQAGDMKEYRSYYAPDFNSRGMSLGKYVEYKTDLARKYKKISVRVSHLKVSFSGTQNAVATFKQHYSAAGGMKTTGTKKLELKKTGNAWKIYRETMGR